MRFLIKPTAPAFPGFPREEPLVFNLRKPAAGGSWLILICCFPFMEVILAGPRIRTLILLPRFLWKSPKQSFEGQDFLVPWFPEGPATESYYSSTWAMRERRWSRLVHAVFSHEDRLCSSLPGSWGWTPSLCQRCLAAEYLSRTWTVSSFDFYNWGIDHLVQCSFSWGLIV